MERGYRWERRPACLKRVKPKLRLRVETSDEILACAVASLTVEAFPWEGLAAVRRLLRVAVGRLCCLPRPAKEQEWVEVWREL